MEYTKKNQFFPYGQDGETEPATTEAMAYYVWLVNAGYEYVNLDYRADGILVSATN